MNTLGPLLGSLGLPVLKSLIENFVPGVPGKVAGVALQAIGDALQTPADAGAIAAAINQDPAAATIALQPIERDYAAELEQLAKIETVRSAAMETQHQLQTVELTAPGLTQRIWRPFLGLLFAFECAGVVLTVCLVILRGVHAGLDLGSLAGLLGLVGTVFVSQAGLLGYDVRQERLSNRDAAS